MPAGFSFHQRDPAHVARMPSPLWMTFPALEAVDEFDHGFTLRHPEIDVRTERDEAIRRLTDWHLQLMGDEMDVAPASLVTAQQVHGKVVAVVTAETSGVAPGTDGLI